MILFTAHAGALLVGRWMPAQNEPRNVPSTTTTASAIKGVMTATTKMSP